MLKLEMLRLFQIVADEGSLSRAAVRLGRTPSAVSMMLSQLQDELGAELFETERKNRLTPFGALVLAEANRALNAFDRGVLAIRRYARSTAGLVRVAAVPSATLTLLPETIADFRRQRPDVRLEISDVDTASVQRRIKLDRADIGIVSTAPDDDRFGVAIQRDALGIVCRAGGAISQAFRAGAPASWALLACEPLIDNPLCHLVKSPIVADLLLQCTVEARNTTALLAFVGSGLGASILPERAIYRDAERLEFIVAEDPKSWRQLSKMHSHERHLSPAALAFWQLIPAMDKTIRS